jgi:hypothetical protein
MRYSNYQDIERAIYNYQSFRGNSCYGFRDKNKTYHVISYATEIYNSKDGLNLTYYSVTTSKLQGIIARAIYNKTLKQLRKEIEKAEKELAKRKELLNNL